MPEVGSSRNTTLGLPRKAMATLSFLLCPPESSSALVLPFSCNPAPYKPFLQYFLESGGRSVLPEARCHLPYAQTCISQCRSALEASLYVRVCMR